jgi:hypothetical protein
VQEGAEAFDDAQGYARELLPETAEKRVREAPGHGRWNAKCSRAGNAWTRPLTAHLATQILHVGENSLAPFEQDRTSVRRYDAVAVAM